MNPEILKSNETPRQTPAQNGGQFEVLTEGRILELAAQGHKQLESLRGEISLKRFYALEEKLVEQEKKLREILDWQEGRFNRLSKYSLILDPRYFEQEFLN